MPTETNIIVFGAGSGLIENIPFLKNLGEIVYVVDNDPAKWGQTIQGYAIHPPEILKEKNPADIIIICSWWKKSIARQLNTYGLTPNKDYFLDVAFSLQAEHYFQIFTEFSDYLKHQDQSLRGKTVLHVGVGHTLVVDILLAMAGARVICSNLDDEMIFFPDISLKKNIYNLLRKFYTDNRDLFLMPPEGVIATTPTSMIVDQDKVLFMTMDMERLPLASRSIDILFTYDLLEHVQSPPKAIEESLRALKSGGIFYHHIHPGNHRPNCSFFDMYSHANEEWLNICKKSGYHHNRWLSCQFITEFGNIAKTLLEATSRTAPNLPAKSAQLMPKPAEEFNDFTPEDFRRSTSFLTVGGRV